MDASPGNWGHPTPANFVNDYKSQHAAVLSEIAPEFHVQILVISKSSALREAE